MAQWKINKDKEKLLKDLIGDVGALPFTGGFYTTYVYMKNSIINNQILISNLISVK